MRTMIHPLAIAVALLAIVPAQAQQHRHQSVPAAAAASLPVAAGVPADAFLWLSDAPPGGRKASPADKPAAKPERGGADAAAADVGERAMTHADVRQLWLRRGNAPAQSAPEAGDAGTVRVLSAAGEAWETPVNGGGVMLSLDGMGFHNAYLTRAVVADGRLDAMVAKAEVLKGTCCKKGVDPAQEIAIRDPSQPLELVRDHLPDEKLFTRLVSGDQVTFTVQSFGKPVAGAVVTLSTQQGWSKTQLSDGDGRVRFVLIRDYFPDWDKFWRLNRQTFLVTAEAQAGPGSWQGQPYQSARLRASLAGKYSPSPADYRSYAFGLGISLAVVVFLGTAVYLYRRRRVRPFREVRFHD